MIRELDILDFHKGYLDLLNQLKPTMTNYDFVKFKDIFMEIYENKNHKIFVVECNKKIIASATVMIETKFIYNGLKLAHIEDVIVDINHRKKGYGNALIKHCISYAKQQGCCKIGLCSKPLATALYEKNNFKDIGTYYALYM